MTEKLKVLDLFSGIGGFSLGLERTGGFETVAFCEIDPFCQKVLKKHWPDVPIYNDVRTLDYDGAVDVITGGFPCQPYSLAGKRKGETDDRDLWPAMLSVIDDYRPSWVIGENTFGFISLGIDRCLNGLESFGYTARAFDIFSCATDLPTLERHVWIVATPNEVRPKGGGVQKIQNIPVIPREFSGSYTGERNRWNLPQSRVCGVGQRVPNRLDRIGAIGNAVDPNIPEMIGYAILEAHNYRQ
jgi:DNA (cytosine-5)-methyltransferase 1